MYNAPESTEEQDSVRKEHDFVSSTFQQYLGVSIKIKKAFHLGQHGENYVWWK